tara:strand:- start:2431 stop:2673 length:243 start_codon:yes stop_codon:yes gene_type:complete
MSILKAKQFIDKMIEELGRSFHPDDDMSEYYMYENGEAIAPTFSKSKAVKLNAQLDDAFESFDTEGECIYGYCLDKWGEE